MLNLNHLSSWYVWRFNSQDLPGETDLIIIFSAAEFQFLLDVIVLHLKTVRQWFQLLQFITTIEVFFKAIEQGKLDLRMGRYWRYEEQGWELGRGRSDKWEEANVLFELVFASIDWILFNLSMRSFIQCIPYYLSIRKQDNKS